MVEVEDLIIIIQIEENIRQEVVVEVIIRTEEEVNIIIVPVVMVVEVVDLISHVVVVVVEDIHQLLDELVEYVTHFNVGSVTEVIHADSVMTILVLQLQHPHLMVEVTALHDLVDILLVVVHDLVEVFVTLFNEENVNVVKAVDSLTLLKEEILLMLLLHLTDHQDLKEPTLVTLSKEVNALVVMVVAFLTVLMLVHLVDIPAVVELVFVMHSNVELVIVVTHANSHMRLDLLNTALVVIKKLLGLNVPFYTNFDSLFSLVHLV